VTWLEQLLVGRSVFGFLLPLEIQTAWVRHPNAGLHAGMQACMQAAGWWVVLFLFENHFSPLKRHKRYFTRTNTKTMAVLNLTEPPSARTPHHHHWPAVVVANRVSPIVGIIAIAFVAKDDMM